MKIYWHQHATRFGFTWLFCCLIALVQYSLKPAQGYWIPFVYSMLIGSCTVALVELGGYFFYDPHSPGRWPRGWRSVALIVLPLVFGFLLGSQLADRYFGWSSWSDARLLQSSLTLSLFAGLAITYFFRARTRTEGLQTQLQLTQMQAAQAQLKLLESQLDPHMLFNTLANLKALIAVDPAKAEIMLDRIIAYLRATLSGSRASEHSLATEFMRLEDYLELMKIRMGTRLEFILDLPKDLADHPIPSLLLQPVVENAIVHGIEPSKTGGRVRVQARAEMGEMRITVSNTGLPAARRIDDLNSKDATSGFGLTQVKERLLSVFGAQASLHFLTSSEETSVVLTWPLA
jgi:sensor histidine kinase YesM